MKYLQSSCALFLCLCSSAQCQTTKSVECEKRTVGTPADVRLVRFKSNRDRTGQVAYFRNFSIFMKLSHFLIVNQIVKFSPSVLSEIASRQEERHNKNTSHPTRQTDTWASGLPPIHQTEIGAKEMFSVTSREEIEKQTG